VNCPTCGTDNRPEARFCLSCGSTLARVCPNGHPVPSGARFCDECGAALEAPGSAATPAAAPPTAGPAAERRLVSVLFADLVGFTTASEHRDPEETRELLSRYFEICRGLIERYGGTVEKFIGDAVVAVWGTPVAQEDDAERAVRTALDLVAAVPELDPALRARAGVLTGEAAVTVGATGQGMVAGDLVNTASRLQSAAEPGTVLVGGSTRRASEAAIAYEDAGVQELKGREEPIATFRALRVTAARGGALKAAGLEPPFVGRDRELRLIKELFHGVADERRAHLVSVVGIAGIGKSRLAWEFEKYLDGVVEIVWWHRGRCLAYGEGVAYWALAEMVRMRALIGEEEPGASALAKLRECIEQHVPDEEERAWIEPHLAQLLGLGEAQSADRQDLFAAWRLFFERLADQGACALVFEDLQWAEPGLLDFIQYLLEWSRNHPLFVFALSRPELGDALAGSSRNATTLALEPLSAEAMEALLDGFVPGLSEELRAEILARAEGVPLYAVETVRMLLDRGLLQREGDVYRPTGPIDALDVPETLHALLAARLDGLSPDERAVVYDASVLGKTFTKQGVAALSGRPETEVEEVLNGLIRKEVVTLQADPRSPERGQYGFLQDLLKRVAYETLSKKERKARHLAAARHLATAWSDEQEIVEVVASHYLDAYRLMPDADDAAEVKAQAREALARAGERAVSLAATVEAARVFSQAAELADDPRTEAELRDRAGHAAIMGAALTLALGELERAHALYEAEGAGREAALTMARLGSVDWGLHDTERALARLKEAYAVLAGGARDDGFAAVAAELAREQFFMGDLDDAQETVDAALDVAEQLWLPDLLSQALNTAGLIAAQRGRLEQGYALIGRALEIALENDKSAEALRAYNNLADMLDRRDRFEEALGLLTPGLALARRVGSRNHEWRLMGETSLMLLWLGRVDEAREIFEQVPEEGRGFGSLPALPVHLALLDGDIDQARRIVDELAIGRSETDDIQNRMTFAFLSATVAGASGDHSRALELVRPWLDEPLSSMSKLVYEAALTAAAELGREADVRAIVERIDAILPGIQPPSLRCLSLRFRARLGEEPNDRFRAAAALSREYGMTLVTAQIQVEHAEWLIGEGRREEAEGLLAEAQGVFEGVGARPWLERIDAGAPVSAAPAPTP
jgi:class 3 adenylate cyclase/tetratricopeptide (TPR) repeat protein